MSLNIQFWPLYAFDTIKLIGRSQRNNDLKKKSHGKCKAKANLLIIVFLWYPRLIVDPRDMSPQVAAFVGEESVQ